MPNLDQLLYILSIVVWTFTIIYAIVVFVRSFLQDGLVIAILQLFSTRVMLPVVLAVSITLISAAVVFVQPTEVGVVVSMVSPGGVRPQPLPAGLHLIIPVLEDEVTYPISWQTYTMSSKPTEGQKAGDDSIRARTSDGQEVLLDSSIIFRVDQERVVTLHIDWQSRYIDDFVRPVIRGIVRTQVSQFKVQEVNSSARKDLEVTLERLLRTEFAAKGLIVDQFLLRDINFTDQYATAIEEKQVALEGEEQAIHEAQKVRNTAQGRRDQLKTEAEGQAGALLLNADAEAKAILLKADAQAKALKLIADVLKEEPNLLTYQYIDKLSPNIRVMLVPSNSPLILPMPELDGMNAPLTATDMLSGSITATMPISDVSTPALQQPASQQSPAQQTPQSLPTPTSRQ